VGSELPIRHKAAFELCNRSMDIRGVSSCLISLTYVAPAFLSLLYRRKPFSAWAIFHCSLQRSHRGFGDTLDIIGRQSLGVQAGGSLRRVSRRATCPISCITSLLFSDVVPAGVNERRRQERERGAAPTIPPSRDTPACVSRPIVNPCSEPRPPALASSSDCWRCAALTRPGRGHSCWQSSSDV